MHKNDIKTLMISMLKKKYPNATYSDFSKMMFKGKMQWCLWYSHKIADCEKETTGIFPESIALNYGGEK
jgi:hypothetical protein